MPQYQIYRCDRPKKKGGGALIAVSCAYICIPLKIPASERFDLVGVDLFNAKCENAVRIINVYRPPNITPGDDDLLYQILFSLASVNFPVIICGDFNYRDLKSSASKNLQELCKSQNFSQLVTFPTRGSNILDLVLTNSPEIVTSLTSEPSFSSSDHNSLSFNVEINKTPAQHFSKQDFYKADYHAMNNFFWTIIFSTCPI